VGGEIAISGPIVRHKLLFRGSALWKDSDGWIENTYLKTKADPYADHTARLQVRWQPSPRLSVDGRLSVSRTTGGAVLYTIFPTTGHANDFSFAPEENILGSSTRTMDDYTVRAEWSGEAAKITYIAGHSSLDESYRGDGDLSHPGGRIATPFGQLGQGQDLDVSLSSHELRVTSPDQRRLRWSAGVYRLDTARTLESQLFADTTGTIAGFVPIVRLAEDDDNAAWAVFGQAGFEPWEHWTFSGSARYDTDTRRQVDLVSHVARTTSFDALQPRVTATYRPSAAFMAYVNAGRGFRSGGYNAPTVTPAIFREELSTNLEVGARTTLVGSRLHIDGAVYVTSLDNAQYFRLDFASASQIIDNMQDVRIKGAEVTVSSRPARGLELYAAFGSNDSRIEDFNGSGAFDGNQTPTNIRSMVNAGAQYAHVLGKRTVGIVRADIQRRGQQYWAPDNFDVQHPINIANLRLSILNGPWSIVGWTRNVGNEKYYVEYGDAVWAGIVSGDDIGWPGRPRTFGLDVTRKF
jgi:iron complex outermembrane receptor protein